MTYLQLKNELKSRLSAEGSVFYTDAKLGDWINQAYLWLAGLYHWPHLEKAKKTTAVYQEEFDYDIYDYPADFRTDSLVRLAVNDELWGEKDEDGLIRKGKISYDDFLSFVEDAKRGNLNKEKVWSDFGRQYFIYPKLQGGEIISVWGLIVPQELTSSTSLTVFIGEPELEEAIIKKAFSIALIKGKRKREAQAEEAEAVSIAQIVYSKITGRQGDYQRKNKPFFSVPDFFK